MKTIQAKVLDAKHLELSEPLSISPGQRITVSLADPEASGPAPSPPSPQHRQAELAWCRSHADALREFAGQWLVLEGDQIVAHGQEPARLVEEARSQGIPVPFVFYVDPPRPDTVKLGL